MDFAHNTTGQIHSYPEIADTSKKFYQLYNDALQSGDLMELNAYLKSKGAPAATLNADGTIELAMPLLYKRKYGGKLRHVW